MGELMTNNPDVKLTSPDIERDASFALGWFSQDAGRDTLLSMGNAPHEIQEPTLESEQDTLREFIDLERDGIQKTWMIRHGDATIGAAWIDLVENHGVEAPSVHLMIGEPSFRGQGIGGAVMRTMLDYLSKSGVRTVHSRHLTSNVAVTRLNQEIGFENDGGPYTDGDGLEWQKIVISLPVS